MAQSVWVPGICNEAMGLNAAKLASVLVVSARKPGAFQAIGGKSPPSLTPLLPSLSHHPPPSFPS